MCRLAWEIKLLPKELENLETMTCNVPESSIRKEKLADQSGPALTLTVPYVSFWIHLIQRISQASSTLGYFLVPIKKKYIKSFCLPVASGESFRYLRNFTSTNKPVSCYCGSWQPSNRSYHGGKKNYENSKTCQQWKIKDITFYFSSLDSLLPQTILPLIEVFTCKPWAPMEFLGAKEKLA